MRQSHDSLVDVAVVDRSKRAFMHCGGQFMVRDVLELDVGVLDFAEVSPQFVGFFSVQTGEGLIKLVLSNSGMVDSSVVQSSTGLMLKEVLHQHQLSWLESSVDCSGVLTGSVVAEHASGHVGLLSGQLVHVAGCCSHSSSCVDNITDFNGDKDSSQDT